MENKWKRNARCRVCNVIFQVLSLFSKGCEEYMSSIGPAAFLGSAVRCSVSFCFCFSFETEDSQGNSPDLGWPKRTAMPLARHLSGRLPGGCVVLWWPILYLNISDLPRNAKIGTYSVWQTFFSIGSWEANFAWCSHIFFPQILRRIQIGVMRFGVTNVLPNCPCSMRSSLAKSGRWSPSFLKTRRLNVHESTVKS